MVRKSVLMLNTGIDPIPPLVGGAIEYHVFNLSKALAKLKWNVHLISNVDRTRNSYAVELIPGVTVYKCSGLEFIKKRDWFSNLLLYSGSGLIVPIKSLQVQRIRKCSIIHAHQPTHVFMLKGFFKEDTPIVFTLHYANPYIIQSENFLHQFIRRKIFWEIFVRKAEELVEKIIVLNSCTKEEMIKEGFSPRKLIFVPNGIDVNFYIQVSSKKAKRYVASKYGLTYKRFCLYVGRLVKEKGIDLLIKAFSQINHNIPLVIVGEGPELEHLKRLAHDLHCEKKIIFLGKLTRLELRYLYRSAMYLLLLSKAEAFPSTLLESLASGLPVIASDISIMREVLKDKMLSKFIVKRTEIEELKDTLIEAINIAVNKPEEYAELIERCRSISLNYDWKIIAKKVISVYEEILSGY
jgi:glycosyltransferase involved in cell wall biosynthesis